MSESATYKASPDELQGARIYGQALWNAAIKEKAIDSAINEIRELVAVLDKQPELGAFFASGVISEEHREALISRVFKGRVSELIFSFLLTLNRADRLSLLRAVLGELEELNLQAKGQVPVLVRSAVALSSDQLKGIGKSLAKRLGKEPVLRTEVDPEILGGLWVRVGDTVFDRTVRSSLRQLRDNILTRSSHEIQSGRDSLDR